MIFESLIFFKEKLFVYLVENKQLKFRRAILRPGKLIKWTNYKLYSD